MRHLLFILLLHSTLVATAQTDTIRIQQYNLLNYGNSANPTSYKNSRLATILQHVQPDILGLNEVFNDSALLYHLRDSVLGPGWQHGHYHNAANQTQISGLFWKSAQFSLRSTALITAVTRDIMAYELRYNDTISTPHDTAFLTVIVAHLKAGTTSEDDSVRALEAAAVAGWLHTNKPRNYIFQGDFNVYSSDDSGYQLLVNHPAYGALLNDPINRPGDWHDDTSFADIHTQSPRTETTGDGGVIGGLDDRFDQILVSGTMLQDTAQIHALPATYKAIGQDGMHFNTSLVALPENTSAPAPVIQALYEMSDHLPVAMDIVVTVKPAASTAVAQLASLQNVTITNPAHGRLELHGLQPGQQVRVEVFDLAGRPLLADQATRGHDIALPAGAAGLRLVQITGGDGATVRKMVMCQ